MAQFFDFSSDKIDIFMFLIDNSKSMRSDTMNVIKGLEGYKESFENFPNANSIAVSVSTFNTNLQLNDFTKVTDIDTSYYADGATVLYYAIDKGSQYLIRYIKEVTEKTGCIPKATFIVLSDGEPCNDKATRNDAKKAISRLNYAGITTVFVAFGKAITSDFGRQIGFMSTTDVTDRDVIIKFLSNELSRSCKEQSKSMKALGANFFSQVANSSSSSNYSKIAEEVLEDDCWIMDI